MHEADAEIRVNEIEVVKPGGIDAILASRVPVLLDFWAPWCRPCRTLEPMLLRVQKRFGDALRVAKVNVDMHDDMLRRFNVRSIPLLVLAIDGRESLRLAAGECPEAHIISELTRHLGSVGDEHTGIGS